MLFGIVAAVPYERCFVKRGILSVFVGLVIVVLVYWFYSPGERLKRLSSHLDRFVPDYLVAADAALWKSSLAPKGSTNLDPSISCVGDLCSVSFTRILFLDQNADKTLELDINLLLRPELRELERSSFLPVRIDWVEKGLTWSTTFRDQLGNILPGSDSGDMRDLLEAPSVGGGGLLRDYILAKHRGIISSLQNQ